MRISKFVITFIIIFLFLIFSSSVFSSPISYTDILAEFEYKIGDCPIDSQGLPVWISNNNEKWDKYKTTNHVAKHTKNNDGTIWFRVKLSNLIDNRSGIYFDEFKGNSIDVYINTKKIYSIDRKWIYYHNSFVLPLQQADSNQYLYIKTSYFDNKFGPENSALVGDYKALESLFITKDIFNMYVGIGLIFLFSIVFISSIFVHGHYKRIGFSLSFILLFIGYILIMYSTNFVMYFQNYEPLLLVFYDIALLCGFPLLTYFFMLIILPNNAILINRLCQIQSFFTIFCLLLMTFNIMMDYKYNKLYAFLSIPFIGILFIMQLIILVGAGIYYWRKGNKNAKLFMFGFSMFAITLLSELIIFVTINNHYRFFYWKLGLISFLIALIIIFLQEYIRSHNMIYEYSNEIKTINAVARTDYLTKILNRMGLTDEIGAAIEEHHVHNTSFFLALCDIDNFKLLNDTYGHNFGDEVLIGISKIIVDELGKKHVVGRWGGEEFLILLLADYKEAYKIIDRIRKKIYSHTFTHKNSCIHVSVTFGMCQYDDSLGFNKCLEFADLALYSGKESGKNIIKVHKI